MIEPGRMICFAAKWVGEDSETMFFSENDPGRYLMLARVHGLLSEADVLLHYNGTSFDERKINRELKVDEFDPPAPYQRIDLYRTVKKRFWFPSGKLDWVCRELELGQKTRHEGFDLWKGCLDGNADSWAKMREYNTHDVELTEELYWELLPWISGLPSYGAEAGADVCPACGGADFRREGFAYTKTGKYQRFQCRDCGTWSRSSHRADHTEIVQVAP